MIHDLQLDPVKLFLIGQRSRIGFKVWPIHSRCEQLDCSDSAHIFGWNQAVPCRAVPAWWKSALEAPDKSHLLSKWHRPCGCGFQGEKMKIKKEEEKKERDQRVEEELARPPARPREWASEEAREGGGIWEIICWRASPSAALSLAGFLSFFPINPEATQPPAAVSSARTQCERWPSGNTLRPAHRCLPLSLSLRSLCGGGVSRHIPETSW